jgi:ADP-heptose:LPS heptosyltransferase
LTVSGGGARLAGVKVLISRTDRLGDTILASPTWQALFDARPDVDITLLTREAYRPLFENDPALAKVLALPTGSRSPIDEFARQLSEEQFDALLALYVDGDVARLIRRTRIPLKTGPLSGPRTWFLFNRPVRQRRSRSLLHEADYNGLLLKSLGIPYRPRPPRVHLPRDGKAVEDALLNRLLPNPAEKPFIVVHPGMGGSAVNWPSARYRELVERFTAEREERVLVTGTAGDEPYLGAFEGITHPRLVDAVGKVDLLELAFLLRRASLFVGPSTGPMHLATALGTPVVALFSPLRVQQPRRWGPYHSRGSVLTPPVTCPESRRCRKDRCADYDCMDRISVDEVLAAMGTWLDGS